MKRSQWKRLGKNLALVLAVVCAGPSAAPTEIPAYLSPIPMPVNEPPSAFALQSPNHGAAVTALPLLTWQNTSDPDRGDIIAYDLQLDDDAQFSSPVPNPNHLEMTESHYQVTGADGLSHNVLYYWRVKARDNHKGETWCTPEQGWSFVILPPNRPPELEPIGDKVVNENQLLSFIVVATDPDGTTPRLTASNLPSGATFTDNGNGTGSLSWTPTYDQAGTYPNVHFQASDGALTNDEHITITVNNVNRAPVLWKIGDKQVLENNTLSLTIRALDQDKTTPRLTASNLPEGASFSDNGNGRGIFTWNTTSGQLGVHPGIHFEANDGELTDSEEINIIVRGLDWDPPSWEKTFGGPFADDAGICIQETFDRGYIIAGWTRSFGMGNHDVYLIKTNCLGSLEWYKTFGGSRSDGACSVQQTSDGGYIIAGWTASFGAGARDVYLIKTDSAGNKEWERTFGGTGTDLGWSVQQTSDGGYIVAGYTASFGNGLDDMYVIRTDSLGTEIWSKTFGGNEGDQAYSVDQTADGGYVVAGYAQSFGAVYEDVYIVKTDADGNEVWSKTFGGGGSEVGFSVQDTWDGGYIVAGWTSTYGAGGDAYLLKIDSEGNLLWDRTFGGTRTDGARSVRETSDGGYVIAGWTQSYGAGSRDVYLVETDSEGNELWSQTFGGDGFEDAYGLQQTSDGGYVMTGWSNSFGEGDYDVYFIKTDGEGNVNVSPPVLMPIGDKVVNEGEVLSFTVQATDADGTIPALTATGAPLSLGAAFTDNGDGTGTFVWVPSVGHIGDYRLRIEASDGGILDIEEITIRVRWPISMAMVFEHVALSWASKPGVTYTIWSCSDLTAGEWNKVGEIIASGDSTFWADNSQVGRVKFYRIQEK